MAIDEEVRKFVDEITEASDLISDRSGLLMKRLHELADGKADAGEEKKPARKKDPAKKKAPAKKKDEGPKKDDVIRAVQRVIEESDNATAKKILGEVQEDAKRVSDLEPENFAAAIEACEAWLDENVESDDDDPTG